MIEKNKGGEIKMKKLDAKDIGGLNRLLQECLCMTCKLYEEKDLGICELAGKYWHGMWCCMIANDFDELTKEFDKDEIRQDIINNSVQDYD